MNEGPEGRIGFGSGSEDYRTCAEPVLLPGGERDVCGVDCEPEPFDVGQGAGLMIAFSCPVHGVHSVIDPLQGTR